MSPGAIFTISTSPCSLSNILINSASKVISWLLVIVIGILIFSSTKYCDCSSKLILNKTYGIFYIFLGSAIDGLDGPLARTLNIQSDKGALIDSTIDRVGEMIIWSVICIEYVNNEIELFTVISIVTASGLIPYLRAKGETLNIDNKLGLTPRPERVIFAVLYMYFDFSFNTRHFLLELFLQLF